MKIDCDKCIHNDVCYMQETCEDIEKQIAEFGCDNYKTEAESVKHGWWVEKPLDNFRKVEVQCSMCGWRGVDNYDSYVDICDFNYCPNCGAKMDAEE